MTEQTAIRSHGFHEGELAVQDRVGLRQAAARLEGMLAPADLGAGAAKVLGGLSLAALTGRGRDGVLWTTALVGRPGFLDAIDETTLTIGVALGATDPLHDLPPGQPVGLIAVDYARRRRLRLNGTLGIVDPDRLTLTVEEAYGNCPQYIPQRTLHVSPPGLDGAAPEDDAARGVSQRGLSVADRATIGGAASFFLGTTHPSRGNDTSHRGGRAGFVRVDGDTLWWPDYAGNNMFNSLGNLHSDPEAALLFLDFDDHTALHLAGTAELVTVPVGAPGDDGRTGRRVVFTVLQSRRTPLAAVSELLAAYPHNPQITG